MGRAIKAQGIHVCDVACRGFDLSNDHSTHDEKQSRPGSRAGFLVRL